MTETSHDPTQTHDGLIIRPLTPDDLAWLSRLLSDYSNELRGTTRNSMGESTDDSTFDPGPAQALLSDPVAEAWGAFDGTALLGFAVFFDLPEAISGGRAGQLDDLYVDPRARGRRIAQRLIEAIAGVGRSRHWVHLRWLVPEGNLPAQQAYARIAQSAPWKSYVVWLSGEQRW